MKDANIESPLYADPPSASQASRIIAWVSIISASVYGLIVIGSLVSGARFAFWDIIFTVAATHLVIQAGTSAISWKTGARFAKVSLGLFFTLACLSIVFEHNLKVLSVFTVSAIVSLTAVKIDLAESKSGKGV